tara:strand:+ start:117063 stop:117419 length:357 start_codon:yes stop_codon:yes gene_type:complete
MPTYEYRCNNCGHEFELFQSMSAGVKKKCPQCAKMTLERLIGTGAAVIFKGSGFYETDYRSKSYNSDKEADSKASTSSDSKTETKADTKSDTKADTKADKKPDKKSESTPKKTPTKKD